MNYCFSRVRGNKMKYLILMLIGIMCFWEVNSIDGRPPNYSQDQMPVTSFSCRDKILGGYYADPETQCQMFHVCVKVPGLGVQDYKFLCPNDTSFDQENQICDDWYNIDCEASTLYYSDNFDLYRIGSDLGGEIVRDAPRLPTNHINNAVSDVDDDNYLQRGDRGENVGSDLLRGSHSGNFFSNKYRGREEEDLKEELNKKKKAGNKEVRKLLTGKRPVAPATQVAYQDNIQGTQAVQQRPNFVGRNRASSNFQRSQPVTEAPQRQTELYNNQRQTYKNNQRNFYTPTTPKIETTATQRTDYFKNNFYNSATQQNSKTNFYDNSQTYNSQSTFSQSNKNFVTAAPTKFSQTYPTTRNYQSYTTTTTQIPVTYNSQTSASERINNYETQKLFKLNTAAYQDQYEDSKDDEFLKTAHSQNLGASNFNRVQNSLKQWNASISANYNFYQPTTKASTAFQQNYNPTTIRPSSQYYQFQNLNSQQSNLYTPSTTHKPYEQPQGNYFTPTSTQIPQHQNNYATSSTPVRTFPQHQSTYFSPSTTQRPYQQTQNNYYTPSTTQRTTQQQQSSINPVNPTNKVQNNFYTATTPPNTYQQRNFFTQTSSPSAFQQNNFRSASPTPKPFQNSQKQQDNVYNHAATQKSNQQAAIKPRPRGGALYSHTTDATENPRPFTVPTVKNSESKDKEQYDYAYYDDGAQAAEYEVDTVDFARTKSKSRS